MSAIWTQEDRQLCKALKAAGTDIPTLARRFGRSERAIRHALSRKAPNRLSASGEAIPLSWDEKNQIKLAEWGSELLRERLACAFVGYANDNGVTMLQAMNDLLYAGEAA